MGLTHFIEIVEDISMRNGRNHRRQVLSSTANPFALWLLRSPKTTVPNFVPFVPKIVPYPDVNTSHSIVPRRILH
jgi:hypothetical protein